MELKALNHQHEYDPTQIIHVHTKQPCQHYTPLTHPSLLFILHFTFFTQLAIFPINISTFIVSETCTSVPVLGPNINKYCQTKVKFVCKW